MECEPPYRQIACYIERMLIDELVELAVKQGEWFMAHIAKPADTLDNLKKALEVAMEPATTPV